MQPFRALLLRDLRLAWRRSGETLSSLTFLLIALSLFPLGVGAAPELLSRIGAGVLWVLALFAILLGAERLWLADAEDGSLELLLLSPVPLELLALSRALAFWLSHALPLVLFSPLLTLLLAMPPEAALLVPAALLLGTPTLVLLGQVGAALVVGARRGAVLLGLIVLPLYIPVLIFGVGAVENGIMGLGSRPYLLILGAMLLAAGAATPFATAAALRLAVR